ncbi:MAG: hypothetical protein AAGG51_07050 [Cyanobacteria bacterium P01_G01_bin.54]
MYATPQQYRLPRRQPTATAKAIYTPRNLNQRPTVPQPVRYRQNIVVDAGNAAIRPPMPIVEQ